MVLITKIMSKMFHLAIDGNEANITNRVGSNIYAFGMISAFFELTKTNPQLKITVILKKPPVSDLPNSTERFTYLILTSGKFWVYTRLSRHLLVNSYNYDAFYNPGHYLPLTSSVPMVSSIMDLAFFRYPQNFRLTDWLQLMVGTHWAVKKASKIVAISNFTKTEIQKIYHLTDQKIVVAPPGIIEKSEISAKFKNEVITQLHLYQPFFLYVGTLQPRKNLSTLIDSYNLFCQNFQPTGEMVNPPGLVLAGKTGWLAKPILESIKSSPFSKNIIQLGFVDEKQKVALLSLALANLSLSPYEGFGIPPLEGLQYGCLPIVANSASLPEVVGQAGKLVPPNSTIHIANAMDQVIHMSKNQRIRFRSDAKLQLQKFSYQRSAQIVFDTILSLCHQ